MDSLTVRVRDWINERRQYAGLSELPDLKPPLFCDDPIAESFPPGTDWCLGKLQYWLNGSLIQVPVPDFVHHWLAEWRAGKHPAYKE